MDLTNVLYFCTLKNKTCHKCIKLFFNENKETNNMFVKKKYKSLKPN